MAGLRRILAACAVFLAGGPAVCAADPPVDADFAFWQDELPGRAGGVYERGESVFVVSRVPVKPRTRTRAKEEALLEASALLRNWAFGQTRRERGDEPRRPAGVSDMAAFNDRESPGWRIPPWRIDVHGRQFPAREAGGFLQQVQVYDRKTLLAAVPDSYRRHPSDEEVAAAFSAISRRIQGQTK
jgi:hypothetical protein